MSDNSFVHIVRNGKKYTVSHEDADTGAVLGKPIKVASPLEALRKASNIQSEYGISFSEFDDK